MQSDPVPQTQRESLLEYEISPAMLAAGVAALRDALTGMTYNNQELERAVRQAYLAMRRVKLRLEYELAPPQKESA